MLPTNRSWPGESVTAFSGMQRIAVRFLTKEHLTPMQGYRVADQTPCHLSPRQQKRHRRLDRRAARHREGRRSEKSENLWFSLA